MGCLGGDDGGKINWANSSKKVVFKANKLDTIEELAQVILKPDTKLSVKILDIPKDNNFLIKCTSIGFTSNNKFDDQLIQFFIEEICLKQINEEKKKLFEMINKKNDKKEEEKKEEENKENIKEDEDDDKEVSNEKKTSIDNLNCYIYNIFDGRISNGKNSKIYKNHQQYKIGDVVSLKYDNETKKGFLFLNGKVISEVFNKMDLENDKRNCPFILFPKGLKLELLDFESSD
jgi:hypothetical protein